MSHISDDGDNPLVMDVDEFRESLDNNDDLMFKIISVFVKDMPSRLASLKEALESGDMVTATLQSHSIKGAAATVRAKRVQVVSREMERACRAGERAERVSSMITSLEQGLSEFETFVENLRRETSGPT